MSSIIWKSNNRNIQQLSDKFIILLCLYCIKHKSSFRSRSFYKYLDFYNESNIFQSTLKNIEPYKSILTNIDSLKVPANFQIQILENYKKNAFLPENINKHIFGAISISCVIICILLFGPILKYFSHYLNTKSLSDFPLVLTTMFLCSLYLSFIFIKKFLSQVYPERFIHEYIITNFSDNNCLSSLEELYKELNNINSINENYFIKSEAITSKLKEKKKDRYLKLNEQELLKLFYETYSGVQKNFLDVLRVHKYKGKLTLASDYKLINNCNLVITYLYLMTPSSDYDLLEVIFKKNNLSSYFQKNYNSKLLEPFKIFLSQYK